MTHPHAVVDLVEADFATPNVPAGQAKVAHARHGELAQVAVLDARRDERHRDVTGARPESATAPQRRQGRETAREGAHRCTR